MEVLLRTLLVGIVTGSIYALASTGLVLTYKTSGILNLGYGALALLTTFIHWGFTVTWGWPGWLSALVVVLVVAPMIGVFLDTQLFRRIQGQPAVIGIIATVGLTVLVQGVVITFWGPETESVPSLFPQGSVKIIGGATLGYDQIAILIVAAVASGLLAAMLRYTRIGVAFRAVVDNRPVAGLMAINTGFVSALAWALGTAFAALTGILLAPRLFLEPNLFPFFIIIFVLGAAMVGYMRSLPLAFAGGLLIGVVQALLIQYATTRGIIGNLGNAAPFVIMTVLVLFAPRALRHAGFGASFVVRTRELAGQASQRARLGVAIVVFGAMAIVPVVAADSITWRLIATLGMTQSIVFLSLVILTGYSGQISLGHTALMGTAAFTTAHLAAGGGMPVWLAFLLGALAAVPVGALVGIIAVRLHGLFLALMTLALAFMAQALFFNEPAVSGSEAALPLPRPPGAGGDNGFFYLVLGVLILSALVATNLRSGRAGRILAAMRDSETATRSLGINVVKYKVIIFALSAFMAGVGAILTGMFSERVTRVDYLPFFSLVYITVAVIGGIFHVGGAIAAGIFFSVFNYLSSRYEFVGNLQLILFGLGATLALANNPEGMFGEMRRGGHGVLRLMQRGRGPAAEPLPVAGGQK